MAAPIVEALFQYGCDTETALARFLNNEELYIRFLNKFLEDPSFDGIAPAIDSGNNEEYFESVHTLKGVSGNMGITPVFKLACEMVDKYRAGELDASKAMYGELAKTYNEVLAIIKG